MVNSASTSRKRAARPPSAICVISALGLDAVREYFSAVASYLWRLYRLFRPRGKDCLMSRILIAMVAVLAVASLSGCATDWIGKGKGKAPPPEPAPVEQPVIK